MDYIKGIFKNRPNRFIAEVEINGDLENAHVPNTGRCRELLIEGAIVYLKPSDNPKRKTKFSLHFVKNKGVLVSLYSQKANKIVYDAIITGKIKELEGYSVHQREKTIDDSRIDIYLANENEECYVEVKGVTLIIDDEARFPDAPTEHCLICSAPLFSRWKSNWASKATTASGAFQTWPRARNTKTASNS